MQSKIKAIKEEYSKLRHNIHIGLKQLSITLIVAILHLIENRLINKQMQKKKRTSIDCMHELVKACNEQNNRIKVLVNDVIMSFEEI